MAWHIAASQSHGVTSLAEGDLLERMIPGAVAISRDDDDDAKEGKVIAFARQIVIW